MASRTRHNKRKTRKTVKQRGGVWPFTPKAPILTPEEQLKKDALENLTSNGKTIEMITDNEIVGKYTYGVEKNMLGSHVPEYKIYVKVKIGQVTDH
jgi:hypothetical protein